MKIISFVKLRWLRTVLDYLQEDERNKVEDFVERYKEGVTPIFSEIELVTLDNIYSRVKSITNYFKKIKGFKND